MRISDWSSDVCSSDLVGDLLRTLEALARQCRQADLEIFGDREMRKDMPALRDEADPGAGAFVRAHRGHVVAVDVDIARSEEHTSELQSLMRISYAVFCLKKKKKKKKH